MSLRDEIEKRLITVHQASPAGRGLSLGDIAALPDSSPETLRMAVQHLLYVVASLEDIVKTLADRIDPPVSL